MILDVLAIDNFDFTRKIGDFFFGWKIRENVVVLDSLAIDNFDFTRKIVDFLGVKNSWKCCGFVKIEFLDKNSVKRKELLYVNKISRIFPLYFRASCFASFS